MREADFWTWLTRCYVTRKGGRMGPGSRQSYLSNCRRVEQYEGDLDSLFAADGFRSLLARLSYSRQDAAAGVLPRHSVPIEGDLYTRASFRTLRTAASFGKRVACRGG